MKVLLNNGYFGPDGILYGKGEHELPDAWKKLLPSTAEILAEAKKGSVAQADKPKTLDASKGAVDLAKANKIDLATVKGSGADGKIIVTDVQPLVDALGEKAKLAAVAEETAKILAGKTKPEDEDK
tara:strand:- start:10885 stop:11262 length:378 start_codon:yes stop_codon:yes gene_type:complete